MTGPHVPGLVADTVAGDRRALARLLTLVEDGDAADRGAVLAALATRPVAGTRVVGLTGAPGVGKSTLVSALIGELRARDRQVAVLAVDPSSPVTGGALLGDRVRMQQHHADTGVYVRSLAARGRLGGLAEAVPTAVLVLAAAGFDDVIVETVGIGQSEIDVASVADVTVLVLAPGVGDGVQAAKAGVLEVADVLVVNRADLVGVETLEAELAGMLELGRITGAPHAAVPVLRTVATTGEGVAALADALDGPAGGAVLAAGARTGARARSRAGTGSPERTRDLVVELVLAQVRAALQGSDGSLVALLDERVAAVLAGAGDPSEAADAIVAALLAPPPGQRPVPPG